MDAEPTIRIIRGTPTAEELAALVALLRGRTVPAESPPAARSRWAAGALPRWTGIRPGRDGWRSSALPH